MIDPGLILINSVHGGDLNNFLAYIDPGTGSYLFQLLIAGALSVAMFFKNLRLWIFARIGKIFGKSENETKDVAISPASPSPENRA